MVTFVLSTPGVHILVKGWETFYNWQEDFKTRGPPGCLHGAFPTNRPGSFSCRKRTVRQMPLPLFFVFMVVKDTVMVLKEGYLHSKPPVISHTAILLTLYQEGLEFMLVGNSFTSLKILRYKYLWNLSFPLWFSRMLIFLPSGNPFYVSAMSPQGDVTHI